MKLRNKKTGEIVELLLNRGDTYITFTVENSDGDLIEVDYDTIAELCGEEEE